MESLTFVPGVERFNPFAALYFLVSHRWKVSLVYPVWKELTSLLLCMFKCHIGVNWKKLLTLLLLCILQSHTDVKSHLCTRCGKSYKSSHNLVIHMRTHTGSRPFVCPICNKGFLENPALTKHIRTHTGRYCRKWCETKTYL